MRVSRTEEADRHCISAPLYVLAGIAPLSGAIIGYNISTPCLNSRCCEQRLGLRMPRVVTIIDAVELQQSGARIHLVSLRT